MFKPKSKVPPREERDYDKTQLRATQCAVQVHRDYAAHFFRWCFARRFILKGVTILDVGCGQDKPLYRILHPKLGTIPKLYVGVDLNKLPVSGNSKWTRWHPEFNFVERYQEIIKTYGTFDVVTCFEVIEHMKKELGEKLLEAVELCLKRDGVFLLSTPVFDGSAARNHVHEWTIPELATAIKDAGFKVEKRFGTFASQNEIKKVLSPEEAEVYNALKVFYDNDALACFLAPLHPDQSRNNVWILRRL